ncbi:hypothetical protein SKAU_G00237740 [Synaphobranchus kaupii]|uniref:Uncharacterized protein n=1 Tax=Synaphobranchus kaupii TaxID=118154 RepID=A0A9Q1IRW3_SYNKA|nr:hypothetical protein SKAU_G00237740 [Synaphobranchus kaupii]
MTGAHLVPLHRPRRPERASAGQSVPSPYMRRGVSRATHLQPAPRRPAHYSPPASNRHLTSPPAGSAQICARNKRLCAWSARWVPGVTRIPLFRGADFEGPRDLACKGGAGLNKGFELLFQAQPKNRRHSSGLRFRAYFSTRAGMHWCRCLRWCC